MRAKPYRVALLSSEYPPYISGGLGVHVAQVIAALAGRVNYDLFVPTHDDYGSPQPGLYIHNVPVADARSDIEFWLRYCESAARLVLQAGLSVDLIHCHDWLTVSAGIKLRERLGKRLVYNVHLPQTRGTRLHLENIGLVAADSVIVNSEAVRRELAERGLPIRRVEVIPNGVDARIFQPVPDWPADGGYVLFVGRLVPQKGVDVLLRAFAVVLRRCPDSRLVIVGDGDLELYFKRVARYLGFPDRVSFHQWQTGSALVELYQQALAVVIPSYYEPFGIVALEAMACGRPVVASRVGGLEEIIQDGTQGYLVASGNHLELARRLVTLILNPDLRARMGRAGREQAMRFGWERVGEMTLGLYTELGGGAIRPRLPKTVTRLRKELMADLSPELQSLADVLVGPAKRSVDS